MRKMKTNDKDLTNNAEQR